VNAGNLLVWEPPDGPASASDQGAGAAPTDTRKLQFSVIDFGSMPLASTRASGGSNARRSEPIRGYSSYEGTEPGSAYSGSAFPMLGCALGQMTR